MPTLVERPLPAEPEGPAAHRRWSSLLQLIAIFVLWWLLTAAVYRHTASNFLRAESGWFLFLSHSAQTSNSCLGVMSLMPPHDNYSRQVPSLAQVRKQLNLDAETR